MWGYSWEAGQSKQVVYRTGDGHIHELYVVKGGAWRHVDLTAMTGAPAARSLNNGYSWEAGQSKQVVYETHDGHIHELSVIKGGAWQHADLTVITGAPLILEYILSSYSWEAGQSKQVVYRTVNNRIHELSVIKGGAWQHADLTALTGAHYPNDFIFGHGWEAGQSKQVVYATDNDATQNGDIHELSVTVGGAWQHADLIALTGAPPASASQRIYGYGWKAGRSKQVVYWTNDGHIHELYMIKGLIKGGPWQHADLTALTGAPPVGSTFIYHLFHGYSWEAGQSKQVVYRTDDGHMHELYVTVGGTWQHVDLTAKTGAPVVAGDNVLFNGYSWEAGQSKQVVYPTNDGHMHELYVTVGGTWKHVDLTAKTGAPIASI